MTTFEYALARYCAQLLAKEATEPLEPGESKFLMTMASRLRRWEREERQQGSAHAGT